MLTAKLCGSDDQVPAQSELLHRTINRPREVQATRNTFRLRLFLLNFRALRVSLCEMEAKEKI